MFNMGLSEIIILGAIALIVIGPKELPVVAGKIARILNELKRATQGMSQHLMSYQKDIENSFDGFSKEEVDDGDPRPTAIGDIHADPGAPLGADSTLSHSDGDDLQAHSHADTALASENWSHEDSAHEEPPPVFHAETHQVQASESPLSEDLKPPSPPLPGAPKGAIAVKKQRAGAQEETQHLASPRQQVASIPKPSGPRKSEDS